MLWIEESGVAFAFPSFRLVIGILSSELLRSCRDLSGDTGRAPSAFAFAVWWHWPYSSHDSAICLFTQGTYSTTAFNTLKIIYIYSIVQSKNDSDTIIHDLEEQKKEWWTCLELKPSPNNSGTDELWIVSKTPEKRKRK